MSSFWLLVIYCAAILLSSLAGGWIPMLIRLTHTRMQVAMSFIGGAMLGVGLLHLLPHAFFKLGSIDRAVAWMLGGFLLMFFIERVFHFHHHDAPADVEASAKCDHDHDHSHDHKHEGHAHGHSHGHGERPLTWQAALVGLLLHSTLDGVALAAAVAADKESGHGGLLAGLGVFLVVVLHKPFDSMTLGTLMALAGKSSRLRHLVNAGYALAIPAGVLLFNLGAASWGTAADSFVGAALAFAAGTFLCIATSDLLPELQFHSHDRLKLSAALIVGLALAWSIVFLEESGHDHSHAPASKSANIDRAGEDHAHEHDH